MGQYLGESFQQTQITENELLQAMLHPLKRDPMTMVRTRVVNRVENSEELFYSSGKTKCSYDLEHDLDGFERLSHHKVVGGATRRRM